MAAKSSGSFWWFLWLVYIFKLACGDQKNITAETGQNITLPCQAPNNNILIIVVEWSRPDLEPEEQVLFYRDERLNPDYQHPSFKDRVDLQDRQMKDGDVSLTLKNVTTADTGTLECRVIQTGTNRRKRAIVKRDPICIISQSVVPPGPPGGHRKDGVKEGGSVGLIVGLSVSAVVVVGGVFLIYRKCRRRQIQSSDEPPDEQLEMLELNCESPAVSH